MDDLWDPHINYLKLGDSNLEELVPWFLFVHEIQVKSLSPCDIFLKKKN